MSETGWVDIYYPEFWDADAEDAAEPEPGNPDHDGRWSRVTREAYDLNWSKKGWVQIGTEGAPAPVGSLQGGGEVPASTSDEEEPTQPKSSSSRTSAKSK